MWPADNQQTTVIRFVSVEQYSRSCVQTWDCPNTSNPHTPGAIDQPFNTNDIQLGDYLFTSHPLTRVDNDYERYNTSNAQASHPSVANHSYARTNEFYQHHNASGIRARTYSSTTGLSHTYADQSNFEPTQKWKLHAAACGIPQYQLSNPESNNVQTLLRVASSHWIPPNPSLQPPVPVQGSGYIHSPQLPRSQALRTVRPELSQPILTAASDLRDRNTVKPSLKSHGSHANSRSMPYSFSGALPRAIPSGVFTLSNERRRGRWSCGTDYNISHKAPNHVYIAPLESQTAAYVIWICSYLHALHTYRKSKLASARGTDVDQETCRKTIENIVHRARLTPSIFFLALWYITNLPGDPVEHVNMKRGSAKVHVMAQTFVVGCMLAKKYLEDRTMGPKRWHQITELKIELLNKLELAALQMFHWDINCNRTQWHHWLLELRDYHANPNCSFNSYHYGESERAARMSILATVEEYLLVLSRDPTGAIFIPEARFGGKKLVNR